MTKLSWWLGCASMACAAAYPLLRDNGFSEALVIAAKGGSVGLLAVAAAREAKTRGGSLIAVGMALGAAGDMLLEIAFMLGVAAFAAGHATAIVLYLRNRRPLKAGGLAVATGLLLFALLMPAVLLLRTRAAVPFTLYGLLLCAMAGAAWLSRFHRLLRGLGALLFVASDALLASRMGGC